MPTTGFGGTVSLGAAAFLLMGTGAVLWLLTRSRRSNTTH